MKLLILVILLLVIPGIGVAAVELTLDDALRIAREHSPTIKEARELTGAAEQARNAAVAERYPTASIMATSYYNSELTAFGLELPSPLDMTEHYQADARLLLPLFTGGRISGGVAASGASLAYYGHRATAVLHSLWYQTRVYYLSLARAERQVAVAEASLRRTQLVVDDVRSMFTAGTADSLDLLETSSVLIEAEYQLQHATRDHRTAEIKLINHLGLPPDSELRLIGIPEDPAAAEIDFPIEAVRRPDMQAAQSRVNLNEHLIDLSVAERMPTLAAFGGYSVGKPNLDFLNAEWNDYFVIGLNLSWSFNLGNRSGRRIAEQRHRLAAARYERDNLGEAIEREIETTREQVGLARESFAAARRQHHTAAAVFRLATAQHRQGALSTNRLLEIEADLSRAESSQAATLIEVLMAQSQFYYVTGSEKLKEGF